MPQIFQFVNQSSVDLSTKFDKLSHTYGEILQLLYDNDEEFVELLKNDQIVEVEVNNIGQNKGYASYVYQIKLRFAEKSKSYSAAFKVPTVDSWEQMGMELTEADRQHNAQMIRESHNTECDSYEILKDIKDFPAPKIYYSRRADLEQNGMIIMQDLSINGAALGLFFDAPKELCFKLARYMADFQFHVNFLPPETFEGKFNKNMHARASVDSIWMKLIDPIKEFDCEDIQSKAQVILDIDFFALGKYTTETIANEFGCATLCHGDLWSNNMLVKIHGNGSPSDEILSIIDWQTTFMGNPLFDIARFLTNCVKGEERREFQEELVNDYYDYLSGKYEKVGKKINFTREEAHKLFNLALVQETGLLCVMFAVIVLPIKDSKDVKDQENIQKVALRLKLLFDDALVLMEKYGLREKFKLSK